MSEKDTLLHYLNAQRTSVLAIVDGLDDAALRRPVLPSGWTPLGLVAHLCDAERLWGQWVLAGAPPVPNPWPAAGEESAFAVDVPTDVVLEFYREQGRTTDRNLAGADPEAAPVGATPPGMEDLATDVRTLVLHLIEETARHAGHLDVVRELVDGRTGLGPR